MTLYGDSEISSAVFSPDGKGVYVGGRKGGITRAIRRNILD